MTLYDLILRYFLASLSPDCVMQARTVTLAFVDVEIPFSGQFRVQHRTQLDQGWLEILPIDTAPLLLDGDVPYLSKGAVLTATSVQLDHEPAEPPRPLTVARLLHMMEVHGIGTDASIPKHFDACMHFSRWRSGAQPRCSSTLQARSLLTKCAQLKRHPQRWTCSIACCRTRWCFPEAASRCRQGPFRSALCC